MWGRGAGSNRPIGLIAGQGEFPLLFAKAASSMKKEVVLFGAQGYSDKRIESFVKEIHYVPLGGLGFLAELLRKTQVKEVVLAGHIPKKEIYNPSFRPDPTTKSFIESAANKGDDHLLRAFQVFLKVKCGVSVLDSRLFLKDVLAPKGLFTRRRPSASETEDLKFGWKIAKGIGKMDIGQTVVVKHGVVLAVEALEGTDQAIRRGGELGGGETVVVKVAKPNQDLRFDLPCVGLETLESLKAVSSKVIGVESGKTILLSKEELIEKANQDDISLVGL